MRFLIDECVPRQLTARLRGRDDGVDPHESAPRGASDEALLARAIAEDRVLGTRVIALGGLALRGLEQGVSLGVVLVRPAPRSPIEPAKPVASPASSRPGRAGSVQQHRLAQTSAARGYSSQPGDELRWRTRGAEAVWRWPPSGRTARLPARHWPDHGAAVGQRGRCGRAGAAPPGHPKWCSPPPTGCRKDLSEAASSGVRGRSRSNTSQGRRAPKTRTHSSTEPGTVPRSASTSASGRGELPPRDQPPTTARERLRRDAPLLKVCRGGSGAPTAYSGHAGSPCPSHPRCRPSSCVPMAPAPAGRAEMGGRRRPKQGAGMARSAHADGA